MENEYVCAMCGVEIPTESGKQYCKNCEERYLPKQHRQQVCGEQSMSFTKDNYNFLDNARRMLFD